MTSRDTMGVFESPEPFDSYDDSAASSSSSSAPSSSDSLVDDIENSNPQETIGKLKEKLKATKKDLDMTLDACRELRARASEREAEAKRLQERLDEYDDILTAMRKGHVAARDGVKVEVEDWETMINKTLGRKSTPFSLDSTHANLEFLRKLTEDTENLTIEINRTRMIEKENLLRIKALENTLANLKQKNAAEKHSLFNTVEELQYKLTTAESLNESLRSSKGAVETQLAEREKASSKSTKLMNGLREQNEDLVKKLSKRKDEIRELKEQLQSQTNISNPRLRIVSDSARNSPRIQMRPNVKMEEDVECLPDADSDDVIVTKQVVPKRARLMSSKKPKL